MQTISVVNMKGGVGKTTLAVNLAHSLAHREEYSVLIIDLDPQFNATQCIFGGEEYASKIKEGESTVYDIFNENSPEPSSMLSTGKNLTREFSELVPWDTDFSFDILPGNLELHKLDMGAGQGKEFRLKKYLSTFAEDEQYDFVIIDTPPTPSAWMTSALLASDYYLVPVKPEPLSSTGIDLLRGVISRCSTNYSHDIECLGVVFTLAETNTVVYRDTVNFFSSQQIWKDKVFSQHLPKRTKIARAQGEQKMILDCEDAELSTAMVKITDEFLRRVDNGS